MGRIVAFVLKYGPLVSAFALGLQAVLPASGDAVAAQIVSLLAAFGVAPDQAVVGALGEVLTGGLVLIGVVRKLVNLVLAYFGKPSLFGSGK